jgi:hypothetical protein
MIPTLLANSFLFFGSPDDPLWMRLMPLVGLLLLVMGLAMMLRKRRQRAMQPHLTPAEQIERSRELRGVRGDLEQIMVEVEQMARRMSAQLDAKSAHLERLIDEADQRLEQLAQRQSARPDSAAAQAESLRPGSSPSPSAAGRQEPAVSPWAMRNPKSEIPANPQAADPKAHAIFALADQGLTSIDIARQLHEHVGKVELILALRRT